MCQVRESFLRGLRARSAVDGRQNARVLSGVLRPLRAAARRSRAQARTKEKAITPGPLDTDNSDSLEIAAWLTGKIAGFPLD